MKPAYLRGISDTAAIWLRESMALRDETAARGTPEQGPRLPAPDVVLPKLASEADVAPEVWQRVLRLNRFGDRPEPLILASMYGHLAHAPAFLQRLETALAPVQADGSLDHAIVTNRQAARRPACILARAITADRPQRAPEIEAALSAFLDHAIGKMVTICRAIRTARADTGRAESPERDEKQQTLSVERG